MLRTFLQLLLILLSKREQWKLQIIMLQWENRWIDENKNFAQEL